MLISWIGAHLIVQDQLTMGDPASLLMYCINILMSLIMLSMTIVMITMSTDSTKRIVEVLTEKNDMTAAADPVKQVKDASPQRSPKHESLGIYGHAYSRSCMHFLNEVLSMRA